MTTEIRRTDGFFRTVSQVRVMAKGLARLAELLLPAAGALAN
jgi:hypothetical protein